MKIIKMMVVGLLISAGFTSCEMKDEIKGGHSAENSGEVGYLDLGVAVNTASNSVVVKATDADGKETPDDYPIQITGITDTEYVKSFESYTALKAAGEVKLPVGSYQINAHSNLTLEKVMGKPYFEGNEKFDIKAGVATTATVTCKMKNSPINLTYSAEFLSTFKSWTITLDDGKNNVLTYNNSDTNPATKYWLVSEGVSVIKMNIKAETTTGAKVTQRQNFVKDELQDDDDSSSWGGGNGLVINLSPDDKKDPENPNGVTGITVTVKVSFDDQEDVVTEEVEVPSDGTTVEPTDPNIPTDPSITSDYLPGGVSYSISGQNQPSGVNVDVNASKGFATITVYIETNNEGFNEAVGLFNLNDKDNPVDIIGSTNEDLKGLLNPPIKGDTTYTLPLDEFLTMMNAFNAGTHTFHIVVTDMEGQKASADLTIAITE